VRILFVCGAGLISGKEIITLALIDGLRARGHEVACVTSTWGTGEFADKLVAGKTPHTRIPLGFISKTFSWPAIRMTLHQLLKAPRLWAGYRSYLRAFKPDVVVQSNFHHAFLLWPLLDRRNTLFHVHDPFLQTDFYRRVFRLLNRRLYGFVGVSEFIKEMLVELGVPRKKAFAVLNGIDVAPSENGFEPSSKPTNLVSEARPAGKALETDRSKGVVTIGIVGQVGAWKGHDDFIEALKELRQWSLSFRGVIYGSGEQNYILSLKDKIAAYDLTAHVDWAGFVKDTRKIFAATDICVVPSRSQDPCPTVALEAAHCGVPVVASKQGGLPELVRDGETGYLVDAGAPQQITQKLKLLVEDAELRGRMARAAQCHGREHLTQTRMVRQMEAIFERVCQDNA
jgi:glycosyltransferase involved in cell wall biosynthesis